MNLLLERQLRRAFNVDDKLPIELWLESLTSEKQSSNNLSDTNIKQGLAKLIPRIEEAYAFHERDIKLRDRSLQISSEELIEVNKRIRQEYNDQQKVVETLRLAVNQLLNERNKPLIDEEFTNLSDLSSLMFELISEQKEANNELILQRRAMDKHGIVATIDLKGTLLTANDKCCQLSGYSRDELIGNNTSIFRVDNISIEEQIEIVRSLVKGEIWQGELNSYTKTNMPWTVFATMVPVVEFDKRVSRLVVICTDISEQKRLARKLKDDRAFHQSITDSIGEGVYAVDGKGKTQFLNPAASKLLGWTLEELEGRRFHDTVHYQKGDGTLLPREQCPVNLTIRSGQSYTSYEDFFTDKRGRLFPISIVAVPLLDKHGTPDGHVGVFNDISGQKAVEQKLHKAYDEAQSANKAKSDFLATMSHEIRTPMNAIIGLTHLALESKDNEQRQQYLEKVQRSSTALLDLINSILDFSKVEANKIDIVDEPFTLTKTIDKLAQVFQVKAQQKQLQLLFDIRCNTNTECHGDSEKIYQVLLNLLSNAIKFTATGHVILLIEKHNNQLMFSVSDTGMGISDEVKSKLFKAFVQADASISREYGGTGLGLAICKRLVELMGGELTLESKVGEGSCFSFSLPVCADEEQGTAPALTVSVPDKVLCIQTHESVSEGCGILAATLSRHNIHCQIVDQAEGLLPTKAAQTIVFLPHDEQSWKSFIKHLQFGEYKALNFNILISPFNKQDVQKRLGSSLPSNTSIIELPFTDTELISALSPHQLLLRKRTTEGLESKKWRTRRLLNKQVLVVDDDPISLEISQQIVSDLGMNVVTASSGEQALALCEMNKFNAILLDCCLPGISGYEVAEQLTQKTDWYTPIIALSADESPEASEKALIAGMCQHLVKPATADEIIHTIDCHIHSGYVEINPTNAKDEFVSSMLTFYKTYSQRSVMSELLDIFHAQDNSSQLLSTLFKDAQLIGATTLEQSLLPLIETRERPEAVNAKQVTQLSYQLDATLRLIAHSIDKSSAATDQSDYKLDTETLLSRLRNVEDALKAYDAKAVEYINSLAANYSESVYAHKINRLKQLATVYDFESAQEIITQLIGDITDE